MHSILTIAEEIQRIYKRAVGSEENTKYVIDKRELYPIISQVANEMLSLSIQGGISTGEITIPPSAIATYSNRVATYADGSWRVSLPVWPLNLPRNMGVWHVCSQLCVDPVNLLYEDQEPMIPISHDDWDLLRSTELHDSGLFEDQIGYYVDGLYIYFTSAPPETTYGPPGSQTTERFVKVKLLISNSDLYGESTVFPIPPDMLSSLVNRVLDILKMNTSTRQEAKQQDR